MVMENTDMDGTSQEFICLDHIAVIVSSEQCLNFYKTLGFCEKARFLRSYDVVVIMEGYGLIIEFFIDSRHSPKNNMPESTGLRHIGLCIESLDTILQSVKCEPVRTDFYGRRITFCKDPDGQDLEFIEMSKRK